MDASLSLEHVMESVVRVTEQRSRENLEQCLVLTLGQLTGALTVSILAPAPRMDGDTTTFDCLAMVDQGVVRGHQPGSADDTNLARLTLQSGHEEQIQPPLGNHAIAIPIQDHGSVVAVMVIRSNHALHDYLNVIRGFAAVYRNFVAILKDAERDTLTGLKNRKTFETQINRIITKSAPIPAATQDRRHHHADDHHWLGIFDIDHFKRINDTYGHVFGDEVLLLFSALMRKEFRTEDVLFRFGGEEFVVLLAPCTETDAHGAFERFRHSVESHIFPQVGQVTVSIGYVRIQPHDIPSSVVGQADEALYWAKRHGRNQVCSYDFLLAEGELNSHTNVGDVELF